MLSTGGGAIKLISLNKVPLAGAKQQQVENLAIYPGRSNTGYAVLLVIRTPVFYQHFEGEMLVQ